MIYINVKEEFLFHMLTEMVKFLTYQVHYISNLQSLLV